MKQLLIFISLSFFVSMTNAQTKQKNTAHTQTGSQSIRVTTHATFNNINSYINHNLRYPEDAFENGIEGTIWVRFLIDEQGIVHNPEVLRDRIFSKTCELEAMRVITAMPPWHPAMYKNKPVAEVKILPVEFRIDR